DVRQRTFRQVPDPLLPIPADDHDLALAPQDLQEHRYVLALVVPSPGPPSLGRPVLEVPRTERTPAAELAQDVPAEGVVGSEPIPHVDPSRPLSVGVPAHRHAMDREVRRRKDVRPVFEQGPIAPEETLELPDPE